MENVTSCEALTFKKKPFFNFVKRFFDILVSFVSIVILIIPMIIIGIIVKCNSKGPAIFRDPRVGKDGKTIYICKYRSMYIDAESRLKKYLSSEQLDQFYKERKISNDPRITSFGRFIRKTSIDELPQLFNIFTGVISLVGPRPVCQRELDENYTLDQKNFICRVKPGLTGYWQAYGRSKVKYENGERQKMNVYYVQKRSLFFDFKILFMTIPAVFKGDGAE